jgi:GAF domain-containing protein
MPDISTEQLRLLYEVSRSLHGLIDLDDLLPFVVNKTKELLGAEGCSVILLDETGRELYFPYVSPESEAVRDGCASCACRPTRASRGPPCRRANR